MLPALTDSHGNFSASVFILAYVPCLLLQQLPWWKPKNAPVVNRGWEGWCRAAALSGEADTQTSPTATTCGFAPSPRGHAHLTATASTLLFLFPLLLRHSLGHLCSYLSSVLLHLYPFLPLWSVYFIQLQGSCARALWHGTGPAPKHSYHQA